MQSRAQVDCGLEHPSNGEVVRFTAAKSEETPETDGRTADSASCPACTSMPNWGYLEKKESVINHAHQAWKWDQDSLLLSVDSEKYDSL